MLDEVQDIKVSFCKLRRRVGEGRHGSLSALRCRKSWHDSAKGGRYAEHGHRVGGPQRHAILVGA